MYPTLIQVFFKSKITININMWGWLILVLFAFFSGQYVAYWCTLSKPMVAAGGKIVVATVNNAVYGTYSKIRTLVGKPIPKPPTPPRQENPLAQMMEGLFSAFQGGQNSPMPPMQFPFPVLMQPGPQPTTAPCATRLRHQIGEVHDINDINEPGPTPEYPDRSPRKKPRRRRTLKGPTVKEPEDPVQ
jgi:hypothetical protein